MKFKSLLLVVGFIPALAMAEVAKPAPEKAPPVVARPVVVTHVYHHYYYHHGLYQPPPEIHHYYQIPHAYPSGPPKISGKPTMEGGARMMDPGMMEPGMMEPGKPPTPQQLKYLNSLSPPGPDGYGPNQNAQGYCVNDCNEPFVSPPQAPFSNQPAFVTWPPGQ